MFFSETIPLPEGATDIEFTVFTEVFVGKWATIYHRIFDEAPVKCYQLMGGAFYAICNEVSCNSLGINGANSNCCNCCKCCDRCDYYKLYNNHK
ncbi:hypothetical protein [Clostridium niameyense]|uniref:hypothetical protein n=1 Tax=Clostridium niameyense TaxID=1622073 RepID=UPI00067F71D5|nr:hypothetical protein [Clostridium niameyense]